MLRSAFAMVAVLLLAGCAGTASVADKPTSSTNAPPPVVDAEFGSLSGNVTTEELTPLGGVEVAVIESGITVNTDEAGQFTINEVPPGSYRLVANRVGYEQVGKKVTVVAGEVTPISFVLKSFVIDNEAHHIAIPSSFFIQFGFGLYDALVAWQVANQSCGDCQKMVDFPRRPDDVALEPVWTPSTNTPATNQQIYVWTEKDVEPGSYGSGTNVHSEYKPNRDHHRFTETERAHLKEFKNFRINVGGGVTSVMVQQKAEVWLTLSYGGLLPDEYSALPK